MKDLALSGLAAAINAACRLDPDTLSRLSNLDGKVINLIIVDWRVGFFILPHPQGVTLMSRYEGEPDTTIKGKLFDLIKLSLNKGSHRAIFETQLEITGDSEVGERIRDIFSQLDIDWEEQLSRICGDSLAHQIGHGLRSLARANKKCCETLQQNFQEFLHYEGQQLPDEHQVDQFIADVTVLQNDVERLAARVERLKRRTSD